jgi:hypothetical protein
MVKLVKSWLSIGLFLTFFYLAGCMSDQDDPIIIQGEGPVVELPIEVDTFNQVNHVIIGDISIIVSDTFSVVLKSHQNILDMMIWEVDDETFYWGFDEQVDNINADEIRCVINLPHDIESVILTGLGSIILSGPKQNNISIGLNGVGYIGAYDLEVSNADVMLGGSGEVEVFVTEELTGLISGNGNVYYRGNPFINLPVTGTGSVVDDN